MEYDLDKLVFWKVEGHRYTLINGSRNLEATISDNGYQIQCSITDMDTMIQTFYESESIMQSIIINENLIKLLGK